MTHSISGQTRVCGVIGDPVEHSLSPVMHNAAFQALDLDYVYVAFHVHRANLAAAISGMRALGLRGLNATIPHKVGVLPLLDAVDPLARQIGAVNTIVNDEGRLTGHNTDAAGFLQALVQNKFSPENKNVVIIGAGGAARAVTLALAGRGAHLIVLNRTPQTAADLVTRVKQAFADSQAIGLEMSDENLRAAVGDADLIVNTTSVGMRPEVGLSAVPARLIEPHHTVFDIVYSPVQTRLLRDAGLSGARTISGLDMLVWQGAVAFELWTGQKAPVEIMSRALREALGEK